MGGLLYTGPAQPLRYADGVGLGASRRLLARIPLELFAQSCGNSVSFGVPRREVAVYKLHPPPALFCHEEELSVAALGLSFDTHVGILRYSLS